VELAVEGGRSFELACGAIRRLGMSTGMWRGWGRGNCAV